ncbi:uncharacterized protein LOC111641058 isoform X2 [Centruroides sculpturatus]|uniref:uncharacterized protein LOC111641058 isoform X2 n=1 Tax=Centruroides sculpturatus TaxID=218467 RepID=UPI000C6E5E73|nr:uncharacterized protein LOC111641058 isoform X2 [Centruroides sculpturatus]
MKLCKCYEIMENFLARIEARKECRRKRNIINAYTEICLKCVLSSFTSIAKVYGYTFFVPCFCHNSNDVNVHSIVTTFYSFFIECFYWIHFLMVFSMIIPVLSEMIPCKLWHLLVEVDVIFVKMLIVNLALTYALTFSIIKRVKLTTNIKLMKSEYFGRKKLHNVINYTRIFVIFLLVTFTICGIALNIFYLYPAIEKEKTYEHEALFCSVEIEAIGRSATTKNVSSEFGNGIRTETSLLNYILTFSKMEFALTLYVCITYAAILFTCVLVGFLASAFTSTMQTSFQDIRRFAQCDLKLEQKLKIVNFMKRFGKASLCLSINGFFDVTKKFPIKMCSALHSVYSGLLNLRTVSKKKNCSY